MPRPITTSRDRQRAAEKLLAWYDRHARTLPWRVPPDSGARPDPYRVWLSEIMLQQTTVAAAIPYFERFTGRWPDVHALAACPLDDLLAAWAGLGYYARARNLHRCAQIVSQEFDGRFPDTEAGLAALPGIGPYTAAAVSAIAFGRSAVVVDGNVERVMARLFAETDPLPGVKSTLRDRAAGLTPERRAGDYAQGVMDLGATVCTPRRPACGVCPWLEDCAGRRDGIADTLPRRTPKAVKPVRSGTVWVGLSKSGTALTVLTVRRPPTGLLGGMLALPTTDWAECPGPAAAPCPADWQIAGEVRHTFTHFHLRLTVMRAVLSDAPEDAVFAATQEAEAAMPTVFAKALRLASRSGR